MDTISNSDIFSQKTRGNSAYQQRQQIRRHHLERKQALRKIFEMGKIVERVGFGLEDLDVVYRILIAAREKLEDQNQA